jgi:hypothetical protein
MGTGNQFFYIDQEGEKMYKVLSNLVAHTWQSVGTIESLSRASIRQMSLEEEYILPKPGTMMIYVSGVYYWLEANGTDVGHPIARPFANDAIIASIFGAKWRTYVIQLSASDVIGAQAGEIIDQATDITVNVAGMKTLKQYRAELKN